MYVIIGDLLHSTPTKKNVFVIYHHATQKKTFELLAPNIPPKQAHVALVSFAFCKQKKLKHVRRLTKPLYSTKILPKHAHFSRVSSAFCKVKHVRILTKPLDVRILTKPL